MTSSRREKVSDENFSSASREVSSSIVFLFFPNMVLSIHNRWTNLFIQRAANKNIPAKRVFIGNNIYLTIYWRSIVISKWALGNRRLYGKTIVCGIDYLLSSG